MFKSTILVAATAILGFSSASAQTTGTRFGLKGGLSFSSLSGTLNSEAKGRTGAVFGPVVRFKPSEQHFAVAAELLFSSQGSRLNVIGSNGTYSTAKRFASYLNLPIMLRQYIGPGYINIGPQLGLLLGPTRAQLKPTDVSVAGGVGMETRQGFTVDARYNFGLLDVENNPDDQAIRNRVGLGGLHHRVIQVSIGYLFGAK